jgi:Putative secretion activating protein
MKRLFLALFLVFPLSVQQEDTFNINENIYYYIDMADINKLVPIILKWEGLFVDDPVDRGGATNMGVTIGTWKQIGYDKDGDGDIDVDDLKLLTKEDVVNCVLKSGYWNKWRADDINNQSIANLVVDWTWGSGVWGIKYPQRILGVKDDGVVGNITLSAVNNYPDQEELFKLLWNRRKKHFEDIAQRDPTQNRFLRGWLNRLNDFKYIEQ